MPALQNHRHELFAQGLVEGKSANQSFIDAGYAENNGNAIRLKGNEKVRNRVAELQAHHQKRHDVTVDTLTDEYEVARELALGIEQPSAAISATSGKAKLHGFDKGEGNVEVNIQQNTVQLTDLELARRLAHVIEAGTLMKTPD